MKIIIELDTSEVDLQKTLPLVYHVLTHQRKPKSRFAVFDYGEIAVQTVATENPNEFHLCFWKLIPAEPNP